MADKGNAAAAALAARFSPISTLKPTVLNSRRFSFQVRLMNKEITQSKIMSVLNWGYEKAVNGVPGLDSAQELAESYMRKGGSRIEQANSLIRWQNTKAGTSGFLSGLGGIITMPATLPANITSVLYVQIRMIAAIAHMGGHNVQDDQVKTLVYVCLTGNSAKDIMKGAGIAIGTKFTQNAIKSISGKTIIAINKKVGFRLVTKFGEKGVINLGKAVPLIGGLIGGSLDSITTNTIGNVARDTFIISN